MSPLSVPTLLTLWEQGVVQQPLEWALAILSRAYPDLGRSALFDLSIGQRDAYLLTLREWAFGTTLACQITCPQCQALLEKTLNTTDIRVATAVDTPETYAFEYGEYTVRFRLPTSRDMASITAMNNRAAARHQILAACLLAAQYQQQPCSIDTLPAEVIQRVIETMDQADPQADMQFALSCPDCRHQWQAHFDIIAFFWREMDRWARQTLEDVHTLALAYGWQEAEILNLSPLRRQFYLDRLNA